MDNKRKRISMKVLIDKKRMNIKILSGIIFQKKRMMNKIDKKRMNMKTPSGIIFQKKRMMNKRKLKEIF